MIKELSEKIPEEIDEREVYERNPLDESNPLKVVLVQEIARYNRLLRYVRNSLINLEKGISGLVVISEDLETVMYSLYEGKVPLSWKFCYQSLKSLYLWVDDLQRRIKQLHDWAFIAEPPVFWISGFSFPTGFTTALLQKSARRQRAPIDQFGWDFQFLPYDSPATTAAKEGAYISGLFIEGAKWDGDKNYIVDADPMKLYYPMPVIQF